MMTSASTTTAPDHFAYADETHHNIGRFRGIALLTLPAPTARESSTHLAQLLRELGVREFKWGRLRSAKNRFAANELLAYAVERAARRALRVDVLTWDIEDSRHKVPGRNDLRNLQRMYYFIFKNVLCHRWPAACVWQLCVDENTFNASADLAELRAVRNWDTGELIAQVNFTEIRDVPSHTEPFIQIADLFAGLAVYSRAAYDKFGLWRATPTAGRAALPRLSMGDHERFAVLEHFDQLCKHHKLGVSLKRHRGLRTYNPAKPINFWWYEPQGAFDKAPD
jgi:hypothetical protein